MTLPLPDSKRRSLLAGLLLGPLAVSQAAWAQRLLATPAQTEGPFYPDRLPLDKDNDLVMNNGRGPARGQITHLSGRVLDTDGRALSGVTVEIWQVDHNGHYIHSGDAGPDNDPAFQGFGRFETDAQGQYRFRTIKPVPYPGRTPHIHVKLLKGGRPLLTTQLYVAGEPLNARDGILQGIRDPAARQSVIRPFLPSAQRAGELETQFDIVLGRTPES